MWGAGGGAALAAMLPASVAAAQLGGVGRPPVGGVPVDEQPQGVYTIDFTVNGSTVNAEGAYPTVNVPRFGLNDFSSYGGSGTGYNPSSFELTLVQLQFTTHFSSSILGENESSNPSVTYTYALPLTSTFLYPDSGSTPLTATITSTGDPAITLGAFDGNLDYLGSSGYTGSDSAAKNSSLFVVAPPNLSSYSGTGTWAVNVNNLVGSQTYAPDLEFKAGYSGPQVWVTTRVVYTYIQIPETSTVIAAAGLAGLVGLTRWRMARRAARA